jgi:hypothetical protein
MYVECSQCCVFSLHCVCHGFYYDFVESTPPPRVSNVDTMVPPALSLIAVACDMFKSFLVFPKKLIILNETKKSALNG